MEFTPLGLACFAYTILAGIWNTRRLLYACLFFMPFSGSAVINVPAVTFGLTPSLYFFLCMLGVAVMRGQWAHISRLSAAHDQMLRLLMAFVAIVCVSNLIAFLEMGLSLFQITQTIFLFTSLSALAVFSLALIDDEIRRGALTSALAGAVFAALWGLVQMGTFYAGIPYPAFLFNNSISDFAFMFDQQSGNVIRIASVAVEPSFFAFSLAHPLTFYLCWIMNDRSDETSGLGKWTLLIGILLVLSTSTSAYLTLCLLAALMLPRHFTIVSAGIFVATMLGIGILTLSPVAWEILREFTVEKTGGYSFNARLETILEALHVFFEHPFLGGGWGSVTSFSAVTLILANLGMAGATLFGAMIIRSIFLGVIHMEADRSFAMQIYAAKVTLVISLGLSAATGLKYVVLDTWFWWALLLALHSRSQAALERPDTAVLANPNLRARHREWYP